MSRTKRFLTGVRFGYVSQAITTIVGFWLTPFLLERLGAHDFGVWATVAQLLAYLLLLDVGIVALVPLDVARASGEVDPSIRVQRIREALARTLGVLLLQLPIIAVAAASLWWLLPARWADAREILAPVLVIFVLCYPFRVANATLEGLQEFRILGRTQLATWSLQTVLVVALVWAGMGLPALVWGWAVQQVASALVLTTYLVTRHRRLLPGKPRLPHRAVLRSQFARGGYISATQVATVLLYGTDVLVISRLLGPAAVVPYIMTAKLVAVLQHQPQMLMHVAMPALGQLRAGGDRERLRTVVSSLGLAFLLISGGIVVVVGAVNEGFVGLWVGRERFGGVGLTFLLLLSMLGRHWATTLNYTNFSFGRERQVAVLGVADGVVTIVSSIALVRLIGIAGVPLASLVGLTTVALPSGLTLLARAMEQPVSSLLRPLAPFGVRLAVLTAASAVVASRWVPDGLLSLAATAAATGIVYALVMFPMVKQSPLQPYINSVVAGVRGRFGSRAEPPPARQST